MCESMTRTVLYQADDQTTNFSLPLATFPWCATLTCATCYRLALARRMEKMCGGRFKGHLANFLEVKTVNYCRLYILESFLFVQANYLWRNCVGRVLFTFRAVGKKSIARLGALWHYYVLLSFYPQLRQCAGRWKGVSCCVRESTWRFITTRDRASCWKHEPVLKKTSVSVW